MKSSNSKKFRWQISIASLTKRVMMNLGLWDSCMLPAHAKWSIFMLIAS